MRGREITTVGMLRMRLLIRLRRIPRGDQPTLPLEQPTVRLEQGFLNRPFASPHASTAVYRAQDEPRVRSFARQARLLMNRGAERHC